MTYLGSHDITRTVWVELRAESVSSILRKNTSIVLYSSSNSLKLFNLCKVLDFGLATENMIDENNYVVPKGSEFYKILVLSTTKGIKICKCYCGHTI